MKQAEFLRMRRALTGPGPEVPCWPVGISPVTFDPGRHAESARALLNEAYAAGGGQIRPFPEWWAEISRDREYDQSLCFAAVSDEMSELAAFAHCWTTAFIKDIAVAPMFRRRGVGRALLAEVFRTFHRRGAASVDLKVQADNPSGATAFYQSLGMFIVSV